jgi:hypothetical protein
MFLSTKVSVLNGQPVQTRSVPYPTPDAAQAAFERQRWAKERMGYAARRRFWPILKKRGCHAASKIEEEPIRYNATAALGVGLHCIPARRVPAGAQARRLEPNRPGATCICNSLPRAVASLGKRRPAMTVGHQPLQAVNTHAHTRRPSTDGRQATEVAIPVGVLNQTGW